MPERVTITPAPPQTRFSLRTREAEGLPPLLASVRFGEGHALGLGPDEWLLLLPAAAPAPTIAGVHALVDVSHRNLGLAIAGPLAEPLLQCGIALDLAEPAFAVGKATRTLHEGVEIVLWRTGATEFRVEVWRSLGEHLLAALMLAAGDLETR